MLFYMLKWQFFYALIFFCNPSCKTLYYTFRLKKDPALERSPPPPVLSITGWVPTFTPSRITKNKGNKANCLSNVFFQRLYDISLFRVITVLCQLRFNRFLMPLIGSFSNRCFQPATYDLNSYYPDFWHNHRSSLLKWVLAAVGRFHKLIVLIGDTVNK